MTEFTTFTDVAAELVAYMNTPAGQSYYFLECGSDTLYQRVRVAVRSWLIERFKHGDLATAQITITCDRTNNIEGDSTTFVDIFENAIRHRLVILGHSVTLAEG